MDRTQNRGLPRPAPQIGASGRHDFELLFDSPNKILKCAQLRHASAAGRASRSSANHTAAAEFEKSHEGPGSQLRADPLSRPLSLPARAAPPDARGRDRATLAHEESG